MRLTLAIFLIVLAVPGCDWGGGDDQMSSSSAPSDLAGRMFAGTTVVEDGDSRPLTSDRPLRVTFEKDLGSVRWEAGCNAFGADLDLIRDRLIVGTTEGTEIRCSDDLQEEDEWLADFFESDPRWRLSDDRITLAAGETEVALDAVRAPGFATSAADAVSPRLASVMRKLDRIYGPEPIAHSELPESEPLTPQATFRGTLRPIEGLRATLADGRPGFVLRYESIDVAQHAASALLTRAPLGVRGCGRVIYFSESLEPSGGRWLREAGSSLAPCRAREFLDIE